LNNPQKFATDNAGNLWITNGTGNSVSEFDPKGVALSPAAGYTSGGINKSLGIALDKNGSAWVANSGSSSIVRLTSAGIGTNFTGNGLSAPSAVSIDAAGDIFVTNTADDSVSGFTGTGAVLTGSPFVSGVSGTPTSVIVSPQ